MNMWHTAADNHTRSHIVNTETREQQLYYYNVLADDSMQRNILKYCPSGSRPMQ